MNFLMNTMRSCCLTMQVSHTFEAEHQGCGCCHVHLHTHWMYLELQIDSPPQRPHPPDIQRPYFSLMMSSSLQKILMNPLTGYIYVHFFGISTHILADLQQREYYCDTEYCSSAARTDPPEGTPISVFFSMLVNLSHSKN